MKADHEAELRAVLEDDLVWRHDEMRRLRNWQADTSRDDLVHSFRRAILVMLYAHLEGFTKIALGEYVRLINRAEVKVSEVKSQLAAAFLAREFVEYRKPLPGDKHDPDAKKAKQVTKDAEFYQLIIEKAECVIYLNTDTVISTDSNLSPAVVRRNLTRLALDDSWATHFAKDMNTLLNKRNAIAHGDSVRLPREYDLHEMENTVLSLCSRLSKNIFWSARNKSYLAKCKT